MAHRVAAHSSGLFPRPESDFFGKLRRAFANHRNYRRTHNELNALSDAELSDLGLSRYDIERVAREAVYGR